MTTPLRDREAVLLACPGPSLADWIRRGLTRADIAVNRAAQGVWCDYWCIGDRVALKFRPRSHRLTLVTPFDCPHKRHGRIDWRSFDPAPPEDAPYYWTTKSALAGVVFAVNLAKDYGCRRVNILGMDMVGRRDFEGVETEGRSDERWMRERERKAMLQCWAAELGIDVRHHVPEVADMVHSDASAGGSGV